MKLLVVSQYFAPENFRVNDLVRGLVERGHQVTVLTGQPNYPGGAFFPGYGWQGPRREHLLGAEVLRVPLVRRAGGGGGRLILNYLSFALTASWAARFRLKGPYDAIFVFETSPITVGLPAAVARRRFGAPILFWVLDLWPDSLVATGAIRSPFLLDQVGRLVAWIYARCSLVLVQSRSFPERVVCHGFPMERIRYFPNWIEPEYIDDEGAAPQPSPSAEGFRIVYAGNIGVAQGFPEIVEAAARLAPLMPTLKWVIAGDGRMAGWLRSEVARRGLDGAFEFLGQLPPTAMQPLFASASALLVSLKADELFARTIPGKVQSYMAAGRPVLAMLDGEGARVLEEAGAGLVCPSGDVEGLVNHVKTLFQMPEQEREKLGLLGREYAHNEFNRERLFDKLESWLFQVTKRPCQESTT